MFPPLLFMLFTMQPTTADDDGGNERVWLKFVI
jgi:hypothetical protein